MIHSKIYVPICNNPLLKHRVLNPGYEMIFNFCQEITGVCEDIMELKGGKGDPPCVFVLYSCEDHSYKVLML